MIENINFIPANKLPLAEGDEISVLCLEGGELKQKKQVVGHGSSAIVSFHTKGTFSEENGVESIEVESVPVGIFARIKDGLVSGEPVCVMEAHTYTQISDGYEMTGTEVMPVNYAHIELSGHPEAESMGEILGAAEMFTAVARGMLYERAYFILPDDRIIPQDEVMGGTVDESNP